MSGHRRFHRHLQRLSITNFSHHDNIRILPQNGSQTRKEGKSDIRPHLSLIQAHHLILDRIFEGSNIYFRLIDIRETRIQRSSLSGTRWSRIQNNSVRISQIFLNNARIRPIQSQIFQQRNIFRLIHNTHYQFLSPHGRKRVGTQIDLFISLSNSGHSGILRKPLFIGSHLTRLDLELGNDTIMKRFRILY